MLIRKDETCRLLGGISHVTLWRLSRDAGFPQSVRITAGLAMWEREEILKFIETRKKNSLPFSAVPKRKAAVRA